MSGKEGGLIRAFAFYGAYHNNRTNQLIHQVFVPAIFSTALVFLTRAPLGIKTSALPSLCAPVLAFLGEGKGGASLTAALPVAVGYAGYYMSLTVVQRPLLGLGAASLVLGALPLAHAWMGNLGSYALQGAIALHVTSWLAQFYGHGVHEGRSPALLDNLFQAIFMAPLFVLMETLMGFGLLNDFKEAVDPIVLKAIADFRKQGGGRK